MKKAVIALLIVVFAVGGVFSGCGFSGENGDEPIDNPIQEQADGDVNKASKEDDYSKYIAGYWVTDYAVIADTGEDYPLQKLYGKGVKYCSTLGFYGDMSFNKCDGIAQDKVKEYDGTYTAHGEKITLTHTDGTAEQAEYIHTNDTIKYYYKKNGLEICEYYKRKINNYTLKMLKELSMEKSMEIPGDTVIGIAGEYAQYICKYACRDTKDDYLYSAKCIVIHQGELYYYVEAELQNTSSPLNLPGTLKYGYFVTPDGEEVYEVDKNEAGNYSIKAKLLHEDKTVYMDEQGLLTQYSGKWRVGRILLAPSAFSLAMNDTNDLGVEVTINDDYVEFREEKYYVKMIQLYDEYTMNNNLASRHADDVCGCADEPNNCPHICKLMKEYRLLDDEGNILSLIENGKGELRIYLGEEFYMGIYEMKSI